MALPKEDKDAIQEWFEHSRQMASLRETLKTLYAGVFRESEPLLEEAVRILREMKKERPDIG